MTKLQLFSEQDRSAYTRRREGEVKLGETIEVPVAGTGITEALQASAARFVLLGIPEDIGVRANGGIGGAGTAWPQFLAGFLNIQATDILQGKDFLLLGAFAFSDWMEACTDAGLPQLREYTALIDDEVFPVIGEIIARGKIPLVIGGGHNNAYPLLKGASRALNRTINVLNLDAHSDFRVAEGRHSGNGFRYACEEGYLERYAMLGLHEAYNSAAIVKELKLHPGLLPLFWEDIFLREKQAWPEAIDTALHFVQAGPFGTELDVDSIEHVLSSAATPLGVSAQQAMLYLYRCGLSPRSVYLHLPEGVARRADGLQDNFTGKLLSYLVQAFVKGVLERR